jgi:GntR family histidine utilization transcriptional repressor
LATVESIADTIRNSGHEHSCAIQTLRSEPASISVARAMEIAVGQPVYHSDVLHNSGRVPIQIEVRYVLPAIAPRYLEQDYKTRTTFDYLREVAEVTDVEQVISASIRRFRSPRGSRCPPASLLVRAAADCAVTG